MANIPFNHFQITDGASQVSSTTMQSPLDAIRKIVDKSQRGDTEKLNADTFGANDDIPVPAESIAGSNVIGDLFKDRNIALKLSKRKAHEEATGGMQTILWDAADNESIHYVFPKINTEDLFGVTTFGTGVFPAFLSNGIEKSILFFPVYKAYSVGEKACSLPGRDPWNSINYDNARAACTAKNRAGEAGWHMASIWDYAVVKLWALRNGFQPRGNTNYGRAHDATHERALRADNAAPGLTTGTPRTRNGTGPATWRHDGTPFGIADLVGNCWEWVDGLKLVDGQIYLPSSRDNYHGQAESGWTGTGVYYDTTGSMGTNDIADANGAPVLSAARTIKSDDAADGLGANAPDYDYTYIGGEAGTRSVTMSGSYDALALATRQLMMQLFVAHKLNQASSPPYAAHGAIYARNYGERIPLVGGGWFNGADAGLAGLLLNPRRSSVSSSIGFRPAFLL